MAKNKDFNIIEIHGKIYTIVDRAREETEVVEIPYTIAEFIKEVENGEICRDPLIQRTDDQWVRKQKAKLIEAILHNRPIGSIALAKGRAESKSYAVTSLVDGLQRTTALVEFKHDGFALDKRAKPVKCKIIDEGGNAIEEMYEIAGKKYSQLPDVLKKFFDKYRLTTFMHIGFSDNELDDIVFCMNNGKTPNSYQKIRFLLGSDNMRLLQPICDSTLWEDVKGCKSKNDSILCCVVRILMMMTYYNYSNLGSAAMTKFADVDFEEYATPEVIQLLSELVDELAEIKYHICDADLDKFNSITIPHYIMALKTLRMKKNNSYDFADFLTKFWDSELYQSFVANCESNGSGGSLYSADSVENRQYDVDDFLDEYLDITENNNGDDKNDECGSESGEYSNEETATESDYTRDYEIKESINKTAVDFGIVPTDSGGCGQTGLFRQQGEENSDNISGCEPTPASA